MKQEKVRTVFLLALICVTLLSFWATGEAAETSRASVAFYVQ